MASKAIFNGYSNQLSNAALLPFLMVVPKRESAPASLNISEGDFQNQRLLPQFWWKCSEVDVWSAKLFLSVWVQLQNPKKFRAHKATSSGNDCFHGYIFNSIKV
ncbi:MAG: hypothetical protein IPH28_00285 [Cytophagaceae bacterium]|nr:hypothetical protein [Cytophagaceae bacterium]